jgi:hypothetical protein
MTAILLKHGLGQDIYLMNWKRGLIKRNYGKHLVYIPRKIPWISCLLWETFKSMPHSTIRMDSKFRSLIIETAVVNIPKNLKLLTLLDHYRTSQIQVSPTRVALSPSTGCPLPLPRTEPATTDLVPQSSETVLKNSSPPSTPQPPPFPEPQQAVLTLTHVNNSLAPSRLTRPQNATRCGRNLSPPSFFPATSPAQLALLFVLILPILGIQTRRIVPSLRGAAVLTRPRPTTLLFMMKQLKLLCR